MSTSTNVGVDRTEWTPTDLNVLRTGVAELQGIANGGDRSYVAPTGGADATVIGAGLPSVGLRAATYLLPAGLTINQAAMMEGVGMGAITLTGSTLGNDWQDALTNLSVATDATDGLILTAKGIYVDKFGIRYTGVSTATSGNGIRATSANGLRLNAFSVKDFYNGLKLDTINLYCIEQFLIADPVNYGIYITGTDQGDGMIRNGFLLSGPTRNGAAALRWEGGGGVQFSGIKVNCLNNKPWVNGFDFVPTFATSELSVSDAVIDSCTGTGVNVDGTAATLTRVAFGDVKLRASLNPVNAYKINHANVVTIQGGVVEGGTNTLSAFDIQNVNQIAIDDVLVRGIPQANPIVKLASTVNSAKINLTNIGPPGASGAVDWAAGSVYIMSIGQQQGYQDGMHGEFNFTHKAPVFSTKGPTAYNTSLWQIFMNGGCVIEFSMFATITGVTPYYITRQSRIAVNNGGSLAVTTLGTDTSSSTDMDIQWRVSGKNLFIDCRLNSASVGTNVPTAFSTVRITGVPNDLWAFA